LSSEKKYGRVAAIGRFKPLHLGGAAMLESMCESADQVLIGVGSCNKYNLRNPFTAQESEEMIDSYLGPRFDNYSVLQVPDFAQLDVEGAKDGSLWKNHVLKEFGTLDAFVSGNPYVAKLLGDEYEIVHPTTLIDPSKHIRLRAGMVRLAMAQGDERYALMMPTEVHNYMIKNNLVERFCKEFGLATLVGLFTDANYSNTESAQEEWRHTLEV